MRSVALEYKIWWQFKYRKWQKDLYGKKLLESKGLEQGPNSLHAKILKRYCGVKLCFGFMPKIDNSLLTAHL